MYNGIGTSAFFDFDRRHRRMPVWRIRSVMRSSHAQASDVFSRSLRRTSVFCASIRGVGVFTRKSPLDEFAGLRLDLLHHQPPQFCLHGGDRGRLAIAQRHGNAAVPFRLAALLPKNSKRRLLQRSPNHAPAFSCARLRNRSRGRRCTTPALTGTQVELLSPGGRSPTASRSADISCSPLLIAARRTVGKTADYPASSTPPARSGCAGSKAGRSSTRYFCQV